jgi:hypothetical protein
VLGVALSGLLLGHGLAYLVALPDPHQREFVLQRTGHGYLPAFTQIALIVALAGFATVIVRAWAGRRETAGSVGSLARLLALTQALTFVGQEALERLVSGAPLGELAHDHLLPVGVVVQVAVAFLGAALLVQLGRASAKIAASSTPRAPLPRPGAILALRAAPDRPSSPPLGSAASVRAPPSR